jgi:hypothetical protein
MIYRPPGASADLETAQQQLKLIGLQKYYVYDVAVLARNLNIAGYGGRQIDLLRIQPRGPLLAATITLRVLGVTSTQVSLQWTPLPGATWYRVEYRPTQIGSGAWLYSATAMTQGTAAVVENLDQGVQYQLRVVSASEFRDANGQLLFSGVARAGDSAGDQKTSNLVTAIPVQPLTGIPTGLRVTAVRAFEISLAWDAHAGATYYQLQYQLASVAYEPMGVWHTYGSPPAQIMGTAVTLPIDKATSGQVYNLRITAFNTHLPSGDYPGFVGPSAAVVARPIAAPAAPALLAIHPRAARLLYRGLAVLTSSSSLRLLDAAQLQGAQVFPVLVKQVRVESQVRRRWSVVASSG